MKRTVSNESVMTNFPLILELLDNDLRSKPGSDVDQSINIIFFALLFPNVPFITIYVYKWRRICRSV